MSIIKESCISLFQAIWSSSFHATDFFMRLYTITAKNGKKSHRYNKKSALEITEKLVMIQAA
jgi:hypothetical protein